MPIHDDVCRMRFITSHAKQCITYGHCVRKALHNRIRTHTCAVEHVFLVTVRVSAKRFKISKWNLLPFIYPPFVRVPQRFFLFIRWNRQFNLSQAILSGFEFVPICLYQLIIIDCLLIYFFKCFNSIFMSSLYSRFRLFATSEAPCNIRTKWMSTKKCFFLFRIEKNYK